MDKLIFHVDVNSAFLSWTAVKRLMENPDDIDLRLIPSAIGGDIKLRHGVITACSIPAKKLGVRTGEPVIRALEKCPNLILLPADFKTYKEYSDKFLNILKKYSLKVEQVSIDEAYMDMTGTKDPIKMADNIKNEIKETLKFTVNIGISTIKLLAKMASDFEKPNRVHTLYKNEIKEKMWPLNIEKLHGCGRATSRKLRNIGVKTIGDVAVLDKALLCSLLGEKSGEYIHESSNGIGSDEVREKSEDSKSYSNEVTLREDITVDTYETSIKEVIKNLSKSVSNRLKKDRVAGYTIFVSIKTSIFKRHSKQTTLPNITNDDKVIEKIALLLMKKLCFEVGGIFSQNLAIRLVGVGVSHLENEEERQLDIFSYLQDKREREKSEKEEKLKEMVREIEKRFGTGKIKIGKHKLGGRDVR